MAKQAARDNASRSRRAIRRTLPWLAAGVLWLTGHAALAAAPPVRAVECHDVLTERSVLSGGQENLLVDGTCLAKGSTFMYDRVWIRRGPDGKPGKLIFVEPPPSGDPNKPATQEFWASSIIVEEGGELLAGVDDPDKPSGTRPYGSNGAVLTIHLYGAETSGPGDLCSSRDPNPDFVDCGIPKDVWDNGANAVKTLPGGVTDYFYKYGNLHGDSGPGGHFGYKELAVSYGGTLRLRGAKGASGTPAAAISTILKQPEALAAVDEPAIVNSGTDWARLAGGGQKASAKLTLDRSVASDWAKNDEIVVTTTDFFPGHSELARIASVPSAGQSSFSIDHPLAYAHSTTAYDIGAEVNDKTGVTSFVKAIKRADGDDSFLGKAETRAAVALLSRSIRIVSAGDKVNQPFPDPVPGAEHSYMYGGHVVFRQGFAKVQIQGVEFKQLGQGGRLGRYPVHFHIARRVPADTYVIDSSINESMTRWVVLHSTLGVTLARDVGYKSIGHGFFLEDATETDNKLYANIGIYARAPIVGPDNPRGIPGLLDAPVAGTPATLNPSKFHSDSQYPTVFWLTNGWNTLAGNMAAGAGTCGACYWYVPAANHDMIDTDPAAEEMNRAMGAGQAMDAHATATAAPPSPMKWTGYSAMQGGATTPIGVDRAGYTPVRLFYKNYCSTAEHAFNISDPSACTQVTSGAVQVIPNPEAPRGVEPDTTWKPGDAAQQESAKYYPRYTGLRRPAECDPNDTTSCKVANCDYHNPKDCAPTVVSHLTTQFNWAESNFSAVWMRGGFLNVDHMFLADILGPGITMVTGGDYSQANLPKGYWGVVSHSILVGQTQKTAKDDKNKYNFAAGGPLACDNKANLCLDKASGVAFPRSNWGVGQRLYNVYDGPAYEDANAYLDVRVAPCATQPNCMYYSTPGVRRALSELKGSPYGDIPQGSGYMPNAAIGWKQPNGFYYPPAFHSRDLLFRDVDIRHYVIEPELFTGTYRTQLSAAGKEFAAVQGNTTVFNNFSDVDRQTELSDDDGSLTGFAQTVIANEDPFFRAPVQAAECRSNVGVNGSNACAGDTTPTTPTARTSPYDHVTTAILPADTPFPDSPAWSRECSNERCYGVRLYRQNLTGTQGADGTREWETWKAKRCDARFAELGAKARPVPGWDPYSDGKLKPSEDPKDPTAQLAQQFIDFDLECPAPAVRLGGMNLFQRSALTVNNGTYFIDTTRSLAFQQNSPELVLVRRDDPNPPPRRVNVFEGGKAYYLYLLFAKSTTKQTYQIYGGKGFAAQNIVPVRVDVATMPPPPDKVKEAPGAPWLTVAANPDLPGVLDVTLDLSKVPQSGAGKIELDPAKAFSETCKPSTFCTVSDGKCGCDADKLKLGVLAKLSPGFKNVCDQICGHWAVKDLDCPEGGCLGFRFTMPADFVADDIWHRPMPKPFTTPATPATDPWKSITLKRTTSVPDNAAATGGPAKGGCYYAQVPNDAGACKVAD